MKSRTPFLRRVLILLVAGLIVALAPAVAAAGQGASCTRADGAVPQPGTVAMLGDVLVITATDRADSVGLSDDGGSVRVVTSFSAGGSFTVSSVEIYGCNGADTISVAPLATSIDLLVHGDGGRDTIDRRTGGGYFVIIDGGSGSDEIHAGDVADVTHVIGGDGNDEIIAGDQSNSSNSVVEGGPGNDRITVGDSLGERWLLYGGPGNDTIKAGDQLDEGPLIWGEAGNDTITVGRIMDGRVGTDIAGGPGRDNVAIGDVAVFRDMAVTGGSGGDSISVGNITAEDATVEVNGGDDNDRLSIGDVTLFNGVIIVDGGPKRDRCIVGLGAVTVVNCER